MVLPDGSSVTVHFSSDQIKDLHSFYKEAIKTAKEQLDKKFERWAKKHPSERHIIIHLRTDMPPIGTSATQVQVPGAITNMLTGMIAQRLNNVLVPPPGTRFMSGIDNSAYYPYGTLAPKTLVKFR